MHSAYIAGQESALSTLGITKTAVSVGYRPSVLKRLGGWLKKKAPTRTGFRDMMIGDPKRFAKELASGHLFKGVGKGKTLIRESFRAPDMFSKAMFYGMPAVETAGIALDDEGDKTRRIGGSLGGAALGLAAYRPLGMIGSIGADMVGRSLGGGIGQAAAHVGSKITGAAPESPPPQPPQYPQI